MRKLLQENFNWLNSYFQKVKWMLEILALFFVLQTFLYQFSFAENELKISEVQALKIVFWILIFIITLLLYIKTDIEYTPEDDDVRTSIFSGAVLSKYVIRLLFFVLLAISGTVFVRQIQLSFSNNHFFYFWFGLGAMVAFEIIRLAWQAVSRIKTRNTNQTK